MSGPLLIFDRFEERHHTDAARVQEFLGPFAYGDNEGFRYWKFGFKAGPKLETFNLLHEISHCAQLLPQETARVTEAGWGLHMPSVWIGRHLCTMPITTKGTERESEVFAIQAHLTEAIFGTKLDEQIGHFIVLLDWLPDVCNIPAPAYDPADRKAQDLVRNKWRENKIREYHARYTPDAIRKRFRENYARVLANARRRTEGYMTNANIADLLDQIQSVQNDGRGVSCVRSMVTVLRRGEGERFFEEARSIYHTDGDKTRNYPALESALVEVFGCRLHGVFSCKDRWCQAA